MALLRAQGGSTALIDVSWSDNLFSAAASASDHTAKLKVLTATGGRLDAGWHMLVTALVLALHRRERDQTRRFLIFLPTYADLEAQHAALCAVAPDLSITALHSSVNVHECVAAMDAPSPGVGRHVFVATNIAESSVTIRDVSVVIDTCRMLQVSWNDMTARTASRVVWCARAACDQRAGRTGRTGPGVVYRLLPRSLYAALAAFEPAQLLLSGLHAALLKLVTMRSVSSISPADVLAGCLDAPPPERAATAQAALISLGALRLGYMTVSHRRPACATRFGEMLASLPVSLDAALLLIAGGRKGYLREASVLAALSATSPLPIVQRMNEQARYAAALTCYHSPRAGGSPNERDFVLLANLAALLHYENGWRRELAARRLLERLRSDVSPLSSSSSSIAEIADELGLGVRTHAPPPSADEVAWCDAREISAGAARRVLDTADMLIEALEKRTALPAFLRLNRSLLPETGRSDAVLSDVIGQTRVSEVTRLLASSHGVAASGGCAAPTAPLCRYIGTSGGCHNGTACHFHHPGEGVDVGHHMDRACWPPGPPSLVSEADRQFDALGYAPGEMLLVLGDGDFAYSKAIAARGAVLAATSLLGRAELNVAYGAGVIAPRLDDLRARGAFVLHGVDATMLHDAPATLIGHAALVGRFDRVVWNFPSGPEDGDDEANATLLARLFLSLTDAMLRRLIAPGCALTLTLQARRRRSLAPLAHCGDDRAFVTRGAGRPVLPLARGMLGTLGLLVHYPCLHRPSTAAVHAGACWLQLTNPNGRLHATIRVPLLPCYPRTQVR